MRLQLNQATARRARNSFCPTDDIHLGEDCLHMRFHSAFTDKKGGADLFVALSLSHQFEYVDLTSAQCFAADTLCELGSKMHGNTSFARVHSADAIHQRFARHVLEQIAFRTRLNRTKNIFVAVECCQHDNSRVLIAAPNLFDCADAIELGHSQVE